MTFYIYKICHLSSGAHTFVSIRDSLFRLVALPVLLNNVCLFFHAKKASNNN